MTILHGGTMGTCQRCHQYRELLSGICGNCGDDLRQEAMESEQIERLISDAARAVEEIDADELERYAAGVMPGQDEMDDLSLGPSGRIAYDLGGDDEYARE